MNCLVLVTFAIVLACVAAAPPAPAYKLESSRALHDKVDDDNCVVTLAASLLTCFKTSGDIEAVNHSIESGAYEPIGFPVACVISAVKDFIDCEKKQ